jgi:hypothetical protein
MIAGDHDEWVGFGCIETSTGYECDIVIASQSCSCCRQGKQYSGCPKGGFSRNIKLTEII